MCQDPNCTIIETVGLYNDSYICIHRDAGGYPLLIQLVDKGRPRCFDICCYGPELCEHCILPTPQ